MEKLTVVERRHLVERLHRHCLAFDGNDAAGGDFGALAGYAVKPAVDGEGVLAERPRDLLFRVVVARMLPRDPAVRYAVSIERQYERKDPSYAFIQGRWGRLLRIHVVGIPSNATKEYQILEFLDTF